MKRRIIRAGKVPMIPKNVRGKGGKFLWATMLRGIPKKMKKPARLKKKGIVLDLRGKLKLTKEKAGAWRPRLVRVMVSGA